MWASERSHPPFNGDKYLQLVDHPHQRLRWWTIVLMRSGLSTDHKGNLDKQFSIFMRSSHEGEINLTHHKVVWRKSVPDYLSSCRNSPAEASFLFHGSKIASACLFAGRVSACSLSCSPAELLCVSITGTNCNLPLPLARLAQARHPQLFFASKVHIQEFALFGGVSWNLPIFLCTVRRLQVPAEPQHISVTWLLIYRFN